MVVHDDDDDDDMLALIVTVADFTFAFLRDAASAPHWLVPSVALAKQARVICECTCENKVQGLVLPQSFLFF